MLTDMSLSTPVHVVQDVHLFSQAGQRESWASGRGLSLANVDVMDGRECAKTSLPPWKALVSLKAAPSARSAPFDLWRAEKARPGLSWAVAARF